MTDHVAICGWCGSRVPYDVLIEHLSEHTKEGTAELREQISVAPIIDQTDAQGDNYPSLPPSNVGTIVEPEWATLESTPDLASRIGYWLAIVLVACAAAILVAATWRLIEWII